jgi:hypothetical protein
MRARPATSSIPSLALTACLAALAPLAPCACSGANPDVFGNVPAPDSGPLPSENNGDGGTFNDGSLIVEAAPAVCDPQSVAGYKPAWTPPEAWKQGVCTSTQIASFYAACLTPPISTAACSSYVQANGACSGCLQTEDTAPSTGAIVWHEHDAYWTVNVAGCLAQAMDATSGTGCGQAYAAAIACRQESCNACWGGQGTTTTFSAFATCEDQAGDTTCATYAQAVGPVCGDLAKGAGSVCMPPSGATAQDAYMLIAPLFCGP